MELVVRLFALVVLFLQVPRLLLSSQETSIQFFRLFHLSLQVDGHELVQFVEILVPHQALMCLLLVLGGLICAGLLLEPC